MVEISLSGSGEGPGKVTTRGYSTISRYWRFSPLNSSLWEVCGRFRQTGFSSSRRFVGGYLRPAASGCPRKSHWYRYLQHSVSP